MSAAPSSDTRPVRPSEQLDWKGLESYVRERLAAALSGQFNDALPMTVEQFPGGHSNLTYLLRFGDQEFVMRRPPFGPVPPRAHDMAREYRILAAVHPVYSLAPRPFVLCEDPGVIGSTFYVMERRRGLVVRTKEPPELADRPKERRRASEAMVNALADRERWEGSRTRTSELPEMDALVSWLDQRLPRDPLRPTMVHGDFKLDNVMLNQHDIGQVVAVFDWEMSAVGDPLVDLGILLAYWVHVSHASQRDAVASVTQLPGWFMRAEVLERYSGRTQLDLTNIAFYEVFALFKLAVVLQQIFYRYHRGQTDDPRFARLDERVMWLVRLAMALAEKG